MSAMLIIPFTMSEMQNIATAENGKVWINPSDDKDVRVYVPLPKLPKLEYSNIYDRLTIYYSHHDHVFTGKNVYDAHPENRKKIMEKISFLNHKYNVPSDF